MEDKVIKVINEVLDEPINLDSSTDNTSNWDSLRHIMIIARIEEELRVEIPIDKVPELKSVQKIVEYLGTKS